MVSCFLWCLRSDLHEILHEGRPLDQTSWKISKLWLPWKLLPWQPKNFPRAHKRLKGCLILSGGALDGKRFVAMDFCYHGNHYVVIATKDAFFRVNRITIRNMLDVTITSLVTWVTSTGPQWHHGWWFDVRVPGYTIQVTNGIIVTRSLPISKIWQCDQPC